jgi:hypothetical protein
VGRANSDKLNDAVDERRYGARHKGEVGRRRIGMRDGLRPGDIERHQSAPWSDASAFWSQVRGLGLYTDAT